MPEEGRESVGTGMAEMSVGPWRIAYDRDATEAAYSTITEGAEACDCKGCLNYLAQREGAFPPEALELFKTLGIDRLKEAEVYDMAGAGDPRPYGGWFHFFGRIIVGPDRGADLTGSLFQLVGDFSVDFHTSLAIPKGDFAESERSVLQLEFTTWLPWLGRRKRRR